VQTSNVETDYEHRREAAMPLKTVATQLLEKAGVDVGEPADLVVRGAAEQYAVPGYSQICDMTTGEDHRTYDLALAILHKGIEQEAVSRPRL
jgi:ferritin-like protein